jgi:hypothetical protein
MLRAKVVSNQEPYLYGAGIYTDAKMFYARYRGNLSRIEFYAEQDDGAQIDLNVSGYSTLDYEGCCLVVFGIDAALGRHFMTNFAAPGAVYVYSSSSIAGPISGSTASGNLGVWIGGSFAYGTPSTSILGVHFCYIWDRFVPEMEARNLARNPYQFLIPA